MKQDELDGDPKFTMAIGFGSNRQVIEKETKDNLENGEDYVGSTKTPYWNFMLDR
jgi:hypothetical protein